MYSGLEQFKPEKRNIIYSFQTTDENSELVGKYSKSDITTTEIFDPTRLITDIEIRWWRWR